jgi:diguanylate cyclase (GGDEF)-like protein
MLALMQEVGLKLISFLDLNSLCQFFIDKTAEILRVGEGYLFLKDSATGNLVFRSGEPGPLEVVKAAAGKLCPVCIPLKIGNGLVGEVRLGAGPGGPLRDIERQMISILANQFTLALQRLRLYETLQGQSITDSLTSVYNRRYFYDLLGKEVQRARRYRRPLSLLMADIDNFKQINDRYGHLLGDAVLQHVARHLKDSLRATDIVARYGGDEFAALMPEVEKVRALKAAGRVLQEMKSHGVETDAGLLTITLSIGVAEFSETDQDVSDLVKKADEALYRAKAEGRNRVCSHE